MNSTFKPDLRSLLEDVEKNEKDTTKTNHEENDLNILKAKIISLEVAKKENESQIIELDSNLLDARLELSRVESDNETLKTEMKAKDDINNVLTAKANEAEETKAGLERKLKTWDR